MKKSNKNRWVNASEIGKAKYCAYAVYLEKQQIPETQQTIIAKQAGDKAHEKLNQRAQSTADKYGKRCYIATCVYGENNPTVETLRRWRDNSLSQHWWGRIAITLYYWLSPNLVKLFGNNTLFHKLMRKLIDALLRHWIKK